MTATAAPTLAVPSLKANRTFHLILAGHVISILGDGFHSVALGLWVLQSTGSAKAMSLVMGIRIAVGILLGPIAGTVVDRSDRRRMMWSMDLLRGALVLALAVLVAVPGTSLPAILLLTALTAIATQFRFPAFSASLIHIVGKENVRQAGSTMQMLITISRIAGPLLGGMLVAAAGGWSAFVADAASFFLCAAFVLVAGSFPSPVATGKQRKPFWRDLTTGFSHIWENPLVGALTMIAPCINFFGNAYAVLLSVMAVKVWQAEPGAFGTLEAMFPLGIGAGAALLTVLPKKLRHRGFWIAGTTALMGPVIVAIALMPGVKPALVVVAILGVVYAMSQTLASTALQSEVAPEIQGRVFGTFGALMNIATPLSLAAAGLFSDWVGPRPVMVAVGIGLGLVGMIGATLRGLRQYD